MTGYLDYRERSCAYSAVDCIVNLELDDRDSALEHLKHISVQLGLMPNDEHCVRRLLSDYGFFLQGRKFEKMTPAETCETLKRVCPDAECALIQPHYMDVGMENTPLHVYPLSMDPEITRDDDGRWLHSMLDVRHVWIRWVDGEDHSPFPVGSRERGLKKSETSMSQEDCKHYAYYQPNPRNNSIGDCVVRAISGVLGVSWSEAMELLLSYGATTVNSRRIYPRLLEDRGFIRCDPYSKFGRHLTGGEFCNLLAVRYGVDVRVFCKIGRLHVVAILPEKDENGNRVYKIHDSWRSDEDLVSVYWIKEDRPEEKAMSTPDKAEDTEKNPLTELRAGTCLSHPRFGKGVVTDTAADGSENNALIRFENGTVRRFDKRWILENCTE